MEIDVKEQEDKLRAELAQLQGQLQQVEQARNNLIINIAKKSGALELLQGLDTKGQDNEQE